MDIIQVLTNLTNGQVMAIGIAAFLCTLIFPRLIRRRRMARLLLEKKKAGERLTRQDLAWEKRRPFTHNAGKGEIEELVVSLKGFARSNGMRIVFPGMVRDGDARASATLLLVGRFGIMMIFCYGFGGEISRDKKGRWVQTMNGQTRFIPDPLAAIEADRALIGRVLARCGWPDVRLDGAAVYTRKDVLLMSGVKGSVFTRQEFLEWVGSRADLLEDKGIDVVALSGQLVKLVRPPEEGSPEKDKEA